MAKLLAGAGVLVAPWMAAAGPDPGFVETWSSGVAGWQDRDADEMAVAFASAGNPGGSLGGTFAESLFPDSDAMRATASSSAGAFVGNYRSKYALIAGWRFDFFAEDLLPSSITLRFGDGTNIFFRSGTAQVTATGVWQSVFLPLDAQAGWSGPPDEFSNALFSVQFVEVEIVRRVMPVEQRYFLDNFELVRLDPRAVDASPSSITWADLKAGATYEIQATTNLNLYSSWTPAGVLVATNAISSWNLPADSARFRCHRLLLADPAM